MSRGQDNGKKTAKAKPRRKTPAKGTVTFGKVSRAKGPPRPDRHGPEGRKRNAERKRRQRANQTAARATIGKAAAEALLERERLRLERIEGALREALGKTCHLLGVDLAVFTTGRRIRVPSMGQWALGVYGLAARAAGLQWADFTNHRRPGLVAEVRACTYYSKMRPLMKAVAAELAAHPKSPVLSAVRDALGVLTAFLAARVQSSEAKHGPRPTDPPSRRRTLAGVVDAAGKRAAKAGAKAEGAKAKSKATRDRAAAKKRATTRKPRQRRVNDGRDFGEVPGIEPQGTQWDEVERVAQMSLPAVESGETC